MKSRQEIIDSDGNRVPNLYRDKSGGISVDDKSLLNKYMMEQANQKRMASLENEIQEIKLLLKEILKNG
jgi:hypothetical protein